MDYLKTARRYHKVGLNILPLTNNKKNPNLDSWKKYQYQRVTEEEITTWFSQPDVTGIILVCGKISGVTVVDDDNYKTGKPLPIYSGLEVKTTSGGRHIYFKYSAHPNKKIKTDEYDFEIHNDGTMVVMPPSVALNKKGELGSYKWLVQDQGNIKLLPILSDDFTAQYQLNEPITTPLENLVEVDLGSQHNALRTLTNKLLFQTNRESWDHVVKPYIWAVANNYNPPHPEQRIANLWRDCTEYVGKKKTEKISPQSLGNISRKRLLERELEKNAPSTGYVGLDALIKGFIPGHLYVVTGDTNVGKTSVSANFAVNLAEQGKKVLYFALEPANTVIDYLDTVAFNTTFDEIKEDYKNDNISVYTKEQINSLDDLVQYVKALPRQDLIIVDHIGYFNSSRDNNFYQAQADTVKKLVQLAKSKKTAIILIAHVNKQYKGDSPSINDISGSASFKQDATDVIIVLREKDQNSPYEGVYLNSGVMIVGKTKSGPNGFIKIYFKDRSAKISETETLTVKDAYYYLTKQEE